MVPARFGSGTYVKPVVETYMAGDGSKKMMFRLTRQDRINSLEKLRLGMEGGLEKYQKKRFAETSFVRPC